MGKEALREKIAPGRPPKLTDQQAQSFRGWNLGRGPRQYGFDLLLWTRKAVQVLILQRLGVGLGLTAARRLLATPDITPKKPLQRAYERNTELAEQRTTAFIRSSRPVPRPLARRSSSSMRRASSRMHRWAGAMS